MLHPVVVRKKLEFGVLASRGRCSPGVLWTAAQPLTIPAITQLYFFLIEIFITT